MAQCVRADLRYVETPVNHYPRTAGIATGSNLKVIARAFRELPKLRKYCKDAALSPERSAEPIKIGAAVAAAPSSAGQAAPRQDAA
jgi:hypothetical protein